MSYRFLDHTADVAVELRAPSREALFAEAVAAFTATVTDPEAVVPDPEEPVLRLEVEAEDAEALLVEWLGEMVYRFDVDGLLFREVGVRVEEVGEGLRLRSEARGERYDEERHPLKVHVKAVTWHGLEVREEADGSWFGRVVFDI